MKLDDRLLILLNIDQVLTEEELAAADAMAVAV